MDLGTGYLGASILGDIGGAVSSWFQQQRLRDAYKKQIENYQRATSPQAIQAGMEAYANPIYAQYSPQVARQAAASLGAGGVADGGYGNALMQQALSGYLANLQQQGAQNYMQGIGMGNQALSGAAGSVGPGFGSSGASMDALKTLMMMQAIRGGGQQNPSVSGTPSGSIASTDSFMPGVNMAGSGQMDIGNPLTYQFQPQSFSNPFAGA